MEGWKGRCGTDTSYLELHPQVFPLPKLPRPPCQVSTVVSSGKLVSLLPGHYYLMSPSPEVLLSRLLCIRGS